MAERDAATQRSETAGAGGRAQLRALAAVDEVLREPAARELLERYPRALVVDAVRAVIERLRADILAAGAAGEASAVQAVDLTAAALVPWAARLLETALHLEGLFRNASTHAAGVVIGDRPLTELTPLYQDPR